MKKTKKTLLSLGLAAFCIVSSSVVASAAAGFGMTLPSTGYSMGGMTTKNSKSTTFYLNVSKTGNNNNYRFWGYEDGNSPTNRSTTQSSASGTGTKYAYYASSSQAKSLVGTYMGLTIKTGPTVYTPMWIEGTFEP